MQTFRGGCATYLSDLPKLLHQVRRIGDAGSACRIVDLDATGKAVVEVICSGECPARPPRSWGIRWPR
jgi:hypothetical protein